MALPMDEQRILEEMERMLAADDPRLASRLAAFGQPGVGQVLRTRRGQATLSLLVLAMIAAVAAVIYLFSAFRLGGQIPIPARQADDVVAAYRPGPGEPAGPADRSRALCRHGDPEGVYCLGIERRRGRQVIGGFDEALVTA